MDLVVWIPVPALITTVFGGVIWFIRKALPLLSDRVNARAVKLERAKRR